MKDGWLMGGVDWRLVRKRRRRRRRRRRLIGGLDGWNHKADVGHTLGRSGYRKLVLDLCFAYFYFHNNYATMLFMGTFHPLTIKFLKLTKRLQPLLSRSKAANPRQHTTARRSQLQFYLASRAHFMPGVGLP